MIDFLLKYWVEFGLGLVATAITAGFKLIHSRMKLWKSQQDVERKAIIAMLHNDLYSQFRYHLEMQEITETDLQNIEQLYTAYHELGGNGTGTELYERVKDLPLKKKG